MTFTGLLNTTVNVETQTRTRDTYGTWTEAWSTKYSGMPCRVQPLSGSEQQIYGSERVVATHRIYCETDYSITEVNRIKHGSVYYNILFVANAAGHGHHQQIDVRQYKGGL